MRVKKFLCVYKSIIRIILRIEILGLIDRKLIDLLKYFDENEYGDWNIGNSIIFDNFFFLIWKKIFFLLHFSLFSFFSCAQTSSDMKFFIRMVKNERWHIFLHFLIKFLIWDACFPFQAKTILYAFKIKFRRNRKICCILFFTIRIMIKLKIIE